MSAFNNSSHRASTTGVSVGESMDTWMTPTFKLHFFFFYSIIHFFFMLPFVNGGGSSHCIIKCKLFLKNDPGYLKMTLYNCITKNPQRKNLESFRSSSLCSEHPFSMICNHWYLKLNVPQNQVSSLFQFHLWGVLSRQQSLLSFSRLTLHFLER